MAAQLLPDPLTAALDALMLALPDGMEVVVRRRTDTRAMLGEDVVHTAARRIVTLAGVPEHLTGHRCLTEALCVLHREYPVWPPAGAFYQEIAERTCVAAPERDMRHAISVARRRDPQRWRSCCPGDERAVRPALARLMGLLHDDLSQGGGR